MDFYFLRNINNKRKGNEPPKKKTKISIKCIDSKSDNKSNYNSNIIIFNKKYNDSLKNLNFESIKNDEFDEKDYYDSIYNESRSFIQFLCEKIKDNQIIYNTFCVYEILKPICYKIILLTLKIEIYFVSNALFYNDEYLSELFNSNEEEKFFSYLLRSYNRFIYSTIVGVIVSIIIDCIFIEEKKIKRTFIREKEDPLQLRYEISIFARDIKTRYNIFIFLCIFISIISWYYVSCFNSVYPGVKIEWIKSSITIIIIMQILSILIILLEAILRGLSFYYKSEKLFKAKQFIS